MSDLISKKAVMEELLAIQDVTYMSTCLTVDECKGKRWMIARAIDAVKDAPTIDAVEVVHGKWNIIMERADKACLALCSICGAQETAPSRIALVFGKRYCSYCGARMDEKEYEQ